MLRIIMNGDGGTTDGEGDGTPESSNDGTTDGGDRWTTGERDAGTADGGIDGATDERDTRTTGRANDGRPGETGSVNEERPRRVSDGGVIESLTDPESLADSGGTEFLEETLDLDEPFYDADVDGRAGVGVTDGNGSVLLLEHPEQPPILPMCSVDPGGDWAAVGRGTVDNVPGLEIDLAAVERVRALEYTDDGQTHTNYYVIFRGVVASDGELPDEPTVTSPDWDANWYDAVPEGRVDCDMGEDIRLFLD